MPRTHDLECLQWSTSAASTSSSADEDRGDVAALAVAVYGVNNWMWVDTISSSSICKITAKQLHMTTSQPPSFRRRVTLSAQSTANITDGRRSCLQNNQCHKQKWKHQRANSADTLRDRRTYSQTHMPHLQHLSNCNWMKAKKSVTINWWLQKSIMRPNNVCSW